MKMKIPKWVWCVIGTLGLVGLGAMLWYEVHWIFEEARIFRSFYP